jgi:RNA polymerase sigma factor (sigma-70 family)
MTTHSEPGGSRPDPGLRAILSERRRLLNLAYRLLGSLADAEDAVQETYARWYAMPQQQQDAIASPGAWLTKVASRICLDLLGSARARRERYVGAWLPEPLPEPTEWVNGRPGAAADPADRVTLDESVSMALLVVLDAMTPAERVAFILHDVFGYPFPDVAEIVGRTPAACRQLASSARRRRRASQPPATPTAQQASIVRAFKRAWEAGDIGALVGRGHRRPRRPARPRRHRDRRRRRPGRRRAPPDPRRRAGRALPHRGRRQGPQPDTPGAYGQRPARPGRPARRRHRGGVRVRGRRRTDHPHLGGTEPRQAPALDGGASTRTNPNPSMKPLINRRCPNSPTKPRQPDQLPSIAHQLLTDAKTTSAGRPRPHLSASRHGSRGVAAQHAVVHQRRLSLRPR